MWITWHDIGVWAIGVLGTTAGNLISLAIVTSVTQTNWFKNFLVKLTDDLNVIKQRRFLCEELKISPTCKLSLEDLKKYKDGLNKEISKSQGEK